MGDGERWEVGNRAARRQEVVGRSGETGGGEATGGAENKTGSDNYIQGGERRERRVRKRKRDKDARETRGVGRGSWEGGGGTGNMHAVGGWEGLRAPICERAVERRS